MDTGRPTRRLMGQVLENLHLALGTLWAHGLRSGLTSLGVMIGTACVVLVGSIMTGLDAKILDELKGFGADTMFIYKFEPGIRPGQLTPEERMRRPLAYEDYEAVKAGCTSCRHVTASLGIARFPTVRYKTEEYQKGDLSGVLPDYPATMNMPVGRGRFFTWAENLHRADVCVIGSDVARALFANREPLGKQITVDNRSFTVIGIFEKRKTMESFRERSMDNVVTIPYLTAKKHSPQSRELFLVAQVQPGMMKSALDQVRGALRKSRRVPHGQKDSFGLTTATAIIREFHQITGAVAVTIVVLSAIGLLVGGVGVMNIMLVSVTERTREIGTRMAIGARRRDILLQFLLEASTLTGAGGVAGIALGVLAGQGLKLLIPGLPAMVPLWSVVLGFSFSVGVGLIFGLWPAMRASRMNPVEALRYE
ncbi:MAG: ABC transporter permease [Candidatus Riflebacteria bacterium]|nr:ABC transporter permease [Candidatus Riflebacteria bacterium]